MQQEIANITAAAFESQTNVARALDQLREQGFMESSFTVIGEEWEMPDQVRRNSTRQKLDEGVDDTMRETPISPVEDMTGDDITPTASLLAAYEAGGADALHEGLQELGLESEEADFLVEAFEAGKTVVVVHRIKGSRVEEAAETLESAGGETPA